MTLSWYNPDFDENIFEPAKSKRFASITYTDSEIDEAIEFLYQFRMTRTITLPAIQLLQATFYFKCATTQELYFFNMRKQVKSIADLQAIVDNMAKQLTEATNTLKKLKPNSTDGKFLASTIRYCKENIRRRIEELKVNNDSIYENHWHGSSLQKILNV